MLMLRPWRPLSPSPCSCSSSCCSLLLLVTRGGHSSSSSGPVLSRRPGSSPGRKKHMKEGERKRREEVSPINWYPGHIAKAEKELTRVLKQVDVVVEVRDARIPLSTCHPSIPSWLPPSSSRAIIVVMLRIDQAPARAVADWKQHFRKHPPYPDHTLSGNSSSGDKVYFIDGKTGKGDIVGLRRQILRSGIAVNKRRHHKGMKGRAVRAAVIGFPNVGKSSLINRILGRKIARAQNVAGFTRKLQWIRVGEKRDDGLNERSNVNTSIDMLDSPGIIPASRLNQRDAMKLAICNDIGSAAYDHTMAAASLCELLSSVAKNHKYYVDLPKIRKRYGLPDFQEMRGEDIVDAIATRKYDDQLNAAADILLSDFRKGEMGKVCLEVPPSLMAQGDDGEIDAADMVVNEPNSASRHSDADDGVTDDSPIQHGIKPKLDGESRGPFEGW